MCDPCERVMSHDYRLRATALNNSLLSCSSTSNSYQQGTLGESFNVVKSRAAFSASHMNTISVNYNAQRKVYKHLTWHLSDAGLNHHHSRWRRREMPSGKIWRRFWLVIISLYQLTIIGISYWEAQKDAGSFYASYHIALVLHLWVAPPALGLNALFTGVA